MADGKQENRGGIETEGLTGSDLQESQSGGDSGLFGGNRDQRQSGEPSSGTGGYGYVQNQQNYRGLHGSEAAAAPDPKQSRGERFDEEQGGGRSYDTLSSDRQDGVGNEFERDQQAHQDRGQSDAEAESDQSGR